MAGGRAAQVWDRALLLRLGLTYAAAVVAGALAVWLRIPLPWMLGPFFLYAALSAAGYRFPLIPMGRELAQVAIGLAIGLRFTPAVLAATVTLLPEMVGATLFLMAVTTSAAFLMRPLAGTDPVTGFFATAAGGMADMAQVAQRYGGVPTSVAVVHAMRVSLVVAVVPFIVVSFGGGASASVTAAAGGWWGGGNPLTLAFGLVFAYFGAVVLKPSPLPNPWLVGPILGGMVLGLFAPFGIVVPGWMTTVAQVVLGTWLGCQFRRDLLTALPRVTASAVVIATYMIAMAAAGSFVLSHVSGLPYVTSFLALAPAAVTEMVLVAKVMHLDAETVAAFHVMRIVIVSSTVLIVYRLYRRIRGDSDGP